MSVGIYHQDGLVGTCQELLLSLEADLPRCSSRWWGHEPLLDQVHLSSFLLNV